MFLARLIAEAVQDSDYIKERLYNYLKDLDLIFSTESKKDILNKEIGNILIRSMTENRVNLDFISKIHSSTVELLNYFKTFNYQEISTIYCEREWRSTKTYKFTNSDIAMIIIPKKERMQHGNDFFYEHFTENYCNDDLLKNIPIVPWETLL